MLERRDSTRHRVLKAGTIAFNRAGVISCRVRNISETGACLEVESPVGIPDQFTLLIENDHLHRPCHVSWRKEKRIGVTFEQVDAAPIAAPKTDLARNRKVALSNEET